MTKYEKKVAAYKARLELNRKQEAARVDRARKQRQAQRQRLKLAAARKLTIGKAARAEIAQAQARKLPAPRSRETRVELRLLRTLGPGGCGKV